jgi:5-hydroxyisourate hydrolase
VSSITTHVLDVSRGKPAAGVLVVLERREGDNQWVEIARRKTDADGRIRDLTPGDAAAGVYRLTFGSAEYFKSRGEPCFYPEVPVTVEISDPTQHYHVPLLLSPFGYSTYRGS